VNTVSKTTVSLEKDKLPFERNTGFLQLVVNPIRTRRKKKLNNLKVFIIKVCLTKITKTFQQYFKRKSFVFKKFV
jgi:SET domain-containing protein